MTSSLAPEVGTGPVPVMADRLDPRDAGAFNNLGVLYASRGMYAEALDVLLHAIALDPRLRTAMRNLEIVSACPGAIARRLEELTARLDINPKDRGARLERARLDRVTGHVADAIHLLDGLIAENAEDGDALFERGLIEQRNGDLRRAEQWFTRAVQAGSRGDARVFLAEVLYQRGQNEQALTELDQYLQHAFDHAEAHRVRAFILGDMGRLEEAQEASRLATALNPALDAIEPNLALDASTVPTPVAAHAAHPVDAHTHLSLGLAFRQRGYLAEARREFDLAQERGEDALRVLHALAELDLIEGHAGAAQSRLELLLVEQDHPRWWCEHGVALHQLGDVAAAIVSYQRALRLDPRHVLAWNNLGVAHAVQGDRIAAADALRRASELDGSLAPLRANLAQLESIGADDQPATLSVIIELQRECPAAVGNVDLLRVGGGAHQYAERISSPAAAPIDASSCDDADALLREGRREEAVIAYRATRMACETRDDAAAPLWRRAALGEVRALCLLHRAAAALPLVRQLAGEAPDDPELRIYFAAGILDERGFPGMQAARMALRQLALQEGPSAALLHLAGDVAQRIHDEGLALAFYRRALAKDPTRPTPRVAIARMLRRRGDLLAARLELVAALAVDRDRADAVLELASLDQEAGRYAEARALLVSYLARVPADCTALTVLAEGLRAESRHADAQRVVERLSRIDPMHAAVVSPSIRLQGVA